MRTSSVLHLAPSVPSGKPRFLRSISRLFEEFENDVERVLLLSGSDLLKEGRVIRRMIKDARRITAAIYDLGPLAGIKGMKRRMVDGFTREGDFHVAYGLAFDSRLANALAQ